MTIDNNVCCSHGCIWPCTSRPHSSVCFCIFEIRLEALLARPFLSSFFPMYFLCKVTTVPSAMVTVLSSIASRAAFMMACFALTSINSNKRFPEVKSCKTEYDQGHIKSSLPCHLGTKACAAGGLDASALPHSYKHTRGVNNPSKKPEQAPTDIP